MLSNLIHEIRELVSSDSREFRDAMRVAKDCDPSDWRRSSSIMKAAIWYYHESSGIEVTRQLIEEADYDFATVRNVRLPWNEASKLFECIDQKSALRRLDERRDVQNFAARLATELKDLDIVNARRLPGNEADPIYRKYFYNGINMYYSPGTLTVMRGECGPFTILTYDDSQYGWKTTELRVLGRNFQQDPVHEHFNGGIADRVGWRLRELSQINACA